MLTDEYVLEFNTFEMTNMKFEGPTIVNEKQILKISCDEASAVGFKINRLGLSAAKASIKDVELHASYMKAYLPDQDRTLEYPGMEERALDPIKSIELEKGVMHFTRIVCSTIELAEVELTPEYVGGAEPYIPLILTTGKLTLDRIYEVFGPESYEKLENKCIKIESGRAIARGGTTSLVRPIEYKLDRENSVSTYKAGWVAQVSYFTADKVVVFAIYMKGTAYMVFTVQATGEEDIYKVMPHGFNAGNSRSLRSVVGDFVYMSADTLMMKDVTLQIE